MAFGPRARRIVFASLLALVLVAVTAFLARNAIATAAARTVASRLLGVNVEIDAVKLDLFGLGVDEKGAAACAALISALFRQRKEARKAVD